MDQQTQHTWRHAVVRVGEFTELSRVLDERGDEGWELVNVVHQAVKDPSRPLKTRRETHSDEWFVFFKQPV